MAHKRRYFEKYLLFVNGHQNGLPTFFKISPFMFSRRKSYRFETISGWMMMMTEFWVTNSKKNDKLFLLYGKKMQWKWKVTLTVILAPPFVFHRIMKCYVFWKTRVNKWWQKFIFAWNSPFNMEGNSGMLKGELRIIWPIKLFVISFTGEKGCRSVENVSRPIIAM